MELLVWYRTTADEADEGQVVDALNTDCTETTGIEPQVVKPKTAAQGESMQIKKQRGGKRPGAGRKPDLVKRMIGSLKPNT